MNICLAFLPADQNVQCVVLGFEEKGKQCGRKGEKVETFYNNFPLQFLHRTFH